MVSSEPLTLSNELAQQLGMKPDARVTQISVDLDFSGYIAICTQSYRIAISKYRTWYPDEDLLLTEEEYLRVCAVLLIKRLSFVHDDLFGIGMVPSGIGKTVLIPEPIFDRLYAYGAVRVGSTLYVPSLDFGSLEPSGFVTSGTNRISPELARRWAMFHSTLEHRWLMSKAMPAKSVGTLMMLFWVDRLTDSNIPRCLTEEGTGADAVMAGMSPDVPLRFKRAATRLELRDVVSLIFTVPYTAVESPDNLLVDYILRSFRGGGQ